MKYISTRGDQTERGFSDILLEGLAPDGGLYLPKTYPRVDAATLARWRGLAYADLAFEILSLYIDDIPADDLRALTRKVYTAEVFGTEAITPLTWLGEGIALQGLSNGPTLAFKDMAMQLLGALFEYELGRRGETLNILGATSGDTGSAAEYAMRGKRGVNVFMLSPHGRMSPFQQAQMFSLQDANIHNIAIEGVFDDAQDIVKAVSNDLAFKREHRIGTVNSINWARLLAQVVYYFAGYFQATKTNAEKVSFTVPSGNFGNVCAGHVARMMGLPIAKLVVATNENDVLDEFFRTGTYRVRGSADTHETSSPSMDISKASNFERTVTVAGSGSCSAAATSTSMPASTRPSPALASLRAAARMPTASPPSAAATPNTASSSTRTRPTGSRWRLRSTSPASRCWCWRRRCRPSSRPPSTRRWASSRRGPRGWKASRNSPSV
jgi:threonine synthase